MNIGCERILISKNCQINDKDEYTVKCSAMPQGKSNSKSNNANSQNSNSGNKRKTEPASRNQSKDMNKPFKYPDYPK